MRFAMQTKWVVASLLVLTMAFSFVVGHKVGRNDEIALQLNDSLTLHLATYKAARAGDTNRAALYMVMALNTCLEQHANANSSALFRWVSGRRLAKSGRTQSDLANARFISASERTNFVVVSPRSAVKSLAE